MNSKKLLLNSLPLVIIGTVMVYAAAPSGGYLPGATTDPDCAVGDTGCFVTLPTDQDNQNLTLSGTNLSIEDGNNVDLGSLSGVDTDDQTLTLSGSTLSISDGNSVTLPSFTDTNTQLTETQVDNFVSNNGYLTGYTDTDTDDQTLTLSGTNLSIEDGNSVTLPSFTDTNTQLTETQVDNFVSNNGYLTGYTDTDTDDQTLTLSGTNLSIEDGNSVTLPSFTDTNTQLTETEVDSFVANNGYLTGYTDTDEQTLTLSGSDLSISDGNSVSLSGISGSNIWTQTGSTTYYNEGNVGIGTTSPNARLSVADSGNLTSPSDILQVWSTGGQVAGGGPGIRFGDGTQSSNARIATLNNGSSGSDLTFETDGIAGDNLTEKMRILGNGNVGIGTTAPTYKLEVSGANSDALINGVRVGKGAGDIETNTVIGNDALASNTTGTHNTASGYQSLYSNTTGSFNSTTGYQSLYYNTIGYSNTATGYRSLYSNTTGTYNTANGLEALYSNTTGTHNTANGMYALYANTTGYSNVSNGYSVLRNNTEGFGNVGNGAFSLNTNTTGSNNAANGNGSLYSNTTGGNNTANGTSALYNNTTGGNNAANGMNALFTNTTGSYNTANGMYSLYNNIDGINNTGVGYAAGDNITTGDNNIIIGANTDAVSATADNQLNIGNWIYGDNGKIGIGTTTPDSKMQVNYGTLADVDLSDIRKTTALTLSGNDPGTIGDSKGVSLTMRPTIGRGAVSAITTLNDGANKEGNVNMTFMTGQGGYPSVMTEHMRIVGSTGNILIGGDSQVGGADPKLLVRNANDALTTSNYAATELLQLSREGTYGDKWSANAQFKLGSYSNHPNARSSLEIALTNANNESVYNTVMTMNGNGDVGIGTTTPAATLHISSTTGRSFISETSNDFVGEFISTDANANLVFEDDSSTDDGNSIGVSGDDMRFRTASVERMRIDEDGNVGIGTTAPSSLFTVSKEVASGTAPGMLSVVATGGANLPGFYIDLDEDNNKVKLRASGNSSPDIAFGSLFNDRLTIKGAGNVGIGTSTPAQKLDVNGNIAVSGTTVHTSDGRLKTNIHNIDNALERILTIKGVSYNWKKETNNTPDRQIGVIAQDVEVEFPELVLENGEYKSVNYSGLIGPIIEAIRDIFTKFLGFKEETNDKFEIMEQRIAELEKRIAELESQ